MDKNIIIINGSGGCGKDTVISFISEVRSVINYSSVDSVKDIAKLIGWNGGKTEKDRKFLSDLKLLTTEYNDMPFNCMKNCVDIFINHTNSTFLFLHIREPKEIDRAVKEFNAKTLLIKNFNVKEIKTNMADANVNNYKYDYEILNNGTLEDLKEKAIEFIVYLEDNNNE